MNNILRVALACALAAFVTLAGAQPFAYVTNDLALKVINLGTVPPTVSPGLGAKCDMNGFFWHGSNIRNLAVAADGNKIYMADQSSGQVVVLDARKVVHAVAALVQGDACTYVVPPEAALTVDPAMPGTVPMPDFVAVSADGNTVFVTDKSVYHDLNQNAFSGYVHVLATDHSSQILLQIGGGGLATSTPRDVAVSPNGDALFVAFSDGYTTSNTYTTSNVSVFRKIAGQWQWDRNLDTWDGQSGGPFAFGVDTDGTTLYVAISQFDNMGQPNSEVVLYDLASNTVAARVPVPGLPTHIALAPGGTHLYVSSLGLNDPNGNPLFPNQVLDVDTAARQVVPSFSLPGDAGGIAAGQNYVVALNTSLDVNANGTGYASILPPAGAPTDTPLSRPDDLFSYPYWPSATAGKFIGKAPDPSAPSDTIGLYDPATGTFFLRNSNTNGSADVNPFTFGSGGPGIVPLVGDWDGDGVTTIGIYVPATGTFFLRNSNTNGSADVNPFTFGSGGPGIVPLVGDWDGDGVTTIGIYVPATGTFFLRNSNTGGPANITFSFGAAGAGFVPLVGDWNGDGRDTIGLYDPATGNFFLKNTNAVGDADVVFSFGAGGAGFVPLVGDWNGDGVDTVGLYDPSNGNVLLHNWNAGGANDIPLFTFGAGGAVPLAGHWVNLP